MSLYLFPFSSVYSSDSKNKILLSNIMEVCRACLSSDKNVMPLNETFINGYNLLTNLNIKPLDGMPQCACETCINAVNYFIDFREQCIQSEFSLQQQLLKNIKSEPEECGDNQESSQSSLEKNCNSPPEKESLPKRPRGRPRKAVASTESKQKRGRPRKNKSVVLEVQSALNSSFEISDYAKITHSQFNHSNDLDFIKEEIKFEFMEISDDNLDLDRKLETVTIVPTISESLPIKHVPKPPENLTPKTSIALKKSVVNETDFPCGLCEKLFETQQSVSSHLEEHKNNSKCEMCNATFPEWQALLAHRVNHLPKIYHHCHMCPKRLHSVETLEYHYLLKHSDKTIQDIKLTCKLCSKAYSTPVKLKKHIKCVHSTEKYICDHCSKSYVSKTSLKLHMRQHSGVKKYVCDTCGKVFNQTTNLKAHIWRKHTATRVYCPSCHRVFPSKEVLQKHKCPHQHEKICPVCGKVFIRNDHLRKHMASHSDVRQYKCEQCPATFKSRDNHRAHTDRHSGHRPHACPHCPKRFYHASLLSRHKRIHAGVRPYVCKVCSKAFNSNYNLKYHMRVHGEYLVAHRNKSAPSDE